MNVANYGFHPRHHRLLTLERLCDFYIVLIEHHHRNEMAEMAEMSSQNAITRAAEPYRALGLSQEDIRLMLLQSGQWDDPICRSLQHVVLVEGELPAYETISYCSGDASD